MGRIDVRVPDEQEELIAELAGSQNYGSRSEFVREAVRNEIRERIDLKQLREAKKRIDEIESGEAELVDHEEVKEKAGIE
jgi:Arc/MetJ-type ribon-helix-helix transcriptional regulator